MRSLPPSTAFSVPGGFPLEELMQDQDTNTDLAQSCQGLACIAEGRGLCLRRFNAIERILEFHKLPQEAPQEVEDRSPPPAWPAKGVIRYQDVWMRYRDGLDPVLKVQQPHPCPGFLLLRLLMLPIAAEQ